MIKKFTMSSMLFLGFILLLCSMNASAESGLFVSKNYKYEDGKIIVNASIYNYTAQLIQNAGVIAIGYDENGNTVEINSDDVSYIYAYDTVYFEIILQRGSLISDVEVMSNHNATEVEVIASGIYYNDNGEAVITAVVENGTNSTWTYMGACAIGYDENGNPIETTSANSTSVNSHQFRTYTLILTRGDLVKTFEVIPSHTVAQTTIIANGIYYNDSQNGVATIVLEPTSSGYQSIKVTGFSRNGDTVFEKSQRIQAQYNNRLLQYTIPLTEQADYFTFSMDNGDIYTLYKKKSVIKGIKYQSSDNSAIVILNSSNFSEKIVCAAFKDEKLTKIYITPVNYEGGVLPLENVKFDCIKVFVWNDLAVLKPINTETVLFFQ